MIRLTEGAGAAEQADSGRGSRGRGPGRPGGLGRDGLEFEPVQWQGGRGGDRGATGQGGCSEGSIRETMATRPCGPRDGDWGLVQPGMVAGEPSKGAGRTEELLWGSRGDPWGSVLQGPRPTEHKGRASGCRWELGTGRPLVLQGVGTDPLAGVLRAAGGGGEREQHQCQVRMGAWGAEGGPCLV